ncbi:hypothetical protein, partial [Xanthomonas fragariae]|uniref:hypothetical protein n=1 Tax=Xanthomonas fragariae TaxID=48664 RepID=UPI001F2E9E18
GAGYTTWASRFSLSHGWWCVNACILPHREWPYGLQSELSNTPQYNRLQAHAAAQFDHFFKEIYSRKEICCGAALQSIAKISR